MFLYLIECYLSAQNTPDLPPPPPLRYHSVHQHILTSMESDTLSCGFHRTTEGYKIRPQDEQYPGLNRSQDEQHPGSI